MDVSGNFGKITVNCVNLTQTQTLDTVAKSEFYAYKNCALYVSQD